MPKKSIEINKFTGGIVSTPSSTDSDPQSASFSLNVDAQESDGRLQGIDANKIYSEEGFSTYANPAGEDAIPKFTSMTTQFRESNNFWWRNFGTSYSSSKSNLQLAGTEENPSGISHGVCWTQVTATALRAQGSDAAPWDATSGVSDISEARYIVINPNRNSSNWDSISQYGHTMSNSSGGSNYDGTVDGLFTVKFHDSGGYLHHIILKRKDVNISQSDPGYGTSNWDNFYEIISAVRATGQDFQRDSDNGSQGWIYGTNRMVGYRTHVYVQLNNYIDFIRVNDTSFTDDESVTNPVFRQEMLTHFNDVGINNAIIGNGIDVNIDLSIDSGDNIRHKILLGIQNLLTGNAGGESIFTDENQACSNYVSSVTVDSTSDSESLLINFNDNQVSMIPRILVNDIVYPHTHGFGFAQPDASYHHYSPFIHTSSNGPTTESSPDDSNVNPGGLGDELLWNQASFTYSNNNFDAVYNPNAIVVDMSECISVSNKDDVSKVDLIGLSTSTSDTPLKALKISDIHNKLSGSIPSALGTLGGTAGEYHIQKDDNAVHFGLGGHPGASPKVVIETKGNRISDNNNTEETNLELSALSPANIPQATQVYEHYIVPPVGNKTYQYTLDTTPGVTLYAALQDSSTKTIENMQIGECFKIPNTTDFTDDACEYWKKYNYDASLGLESGDIFMFCGYKSNTTFPILQFVGNDSGTRGNDGTPAFAYATKGGDRNIYKISLTPTWGNEVANDLTAFDGELIDTTASLQDGDTAELTDLYNVGQRITKLDVGSLNGFTSNGIQAICQCNAPPLYNEIGLIGSHEDPYGSSSSIFNTNGTTKLHYYFGVFYLSGTGEINNVYRINAIDFHNLTGSGPQIESLSLNFSMIPNQLHEDNGNGIIRRTMEDRHIDNEYDPKKRSNWSNIPQDAQIVGLCETYEEFSSTLSDIPFGYTDISPSGNALEIDNPSRLSIGDVVRLKGFYTSSGGATLQRAEPRTMGGERHFDSPETDGDSPNSTGDIYSYKLWIIYRKLQNDTDNFSEWDLFLYNANTTDVKVNKTLMMADRTPPFYQARYYSDGQTKMYYPGQFAFLAKHIGGENWYTDPSNFVTPGETIPQSSAALHWHVYNKSGRFKKQSWSWDSTNRSKDLVWGENIGWDMNEPRILNPVQASLHPMNPYDVQNASNDTDTNGSGHIVTFLARQSGRFIIKPEAIRPTSNSSLAWKCSYTSANAHDWENPNFTNENTTYNTMLGSGEGYQNDFGWQTTSKEYNNSLVLYTIDNFTGHGKNINIKTNDHNQLTDQDTDGNYYAGCKPGAPNWGGSEIENPYQQYDEYEYANSISTGATKGWQGYTAPYAYHPGKGPYVYINRIWKSANPHIVNGDEFALGTVYNPTIVRREAAWPFQMDFDSADNDNYTIAGGQSCNRYHNFSNTAMHDTFFQNTNVAPINTAEHTSSTYTGDAIDRYVNNRFRAPSFLGSTTNPMKKFGGGRLGAACTMFSIDLPDTAFTIWSAFPVQMRGELSATSRKKYNYIVSYVMSITGVSGKPSIAIVRTNFDGLWHEIGNYAGTNDSSTQDWHSWSGGISNISFLNGYSKKMEGMGTGYGTLTPGYAALTARSTSLIETLNITTGMTERTPNVHIHYHNELKLRAAAQDVYEEDVIGARLSAFSPNGGLPYFGTVDAPTHAPTLDLWCNAILTGDGRNVFGYEENMFELDDTGDSTGYPDDDGTGGGDDHYPEDSGGKFSYPEATNNEIFTGLNDDSIRVLGESFIEFSDGVSLDSPLDVGTYNYKLTLEYDGQYESPLNIGKPFSKELTSQSDNAIRIKINLPKTFINSLNKRVTGIGIWRRKDGNTEDAYSQFSHNHILDFNDIRWSYESVGSKWTITIDDEDESGAQYQDLIGIPQTLDNTSINYGLSAVHQGYMYIAKCWNNDTENIRRYIFKSQPFNFFAFDWTKDYLIMPEVPKALASWNSRLYAWGKNSLYKIDPYSLVIEDIYDGVSIFNKNAFVKTEFGLCFFDDNNIYLHNGNQPVPIGDAILYSSNTKIEYHTVTGNTTSDQGHVKIEQGFKELLSSTVANGDDVNIHYVGDKNSFIITLSDTLKNGRLFAYNLRKQRWDLWSSPRASASTTTKDSSLLITDGISLYNIFKATSKQYTDYNKKSWDWHSKDLAFNVEAQDKVFKTLSLSGTPSVFNYNLNNVNIYDSTLTTMSSNSIQAYIDDNQIALSVYNNFYSTADLGGTLLKDTISTTDSASDISIYTAIRTIKSDGTIQSGDGAFPEVVQTYIRPGHLIKIDDEIMFITSIEIQDANYIPSTDTYKTVLSVTRGVMGTTKATHSSGASVYIVSPKLKFPSGSKGRRLNIRLLNQKGYVDSIGVTYKEKTIK